MTAFTDAIVLAGGMGTRLRAAIADVPKPMAPVAGRPFLAYLLDDLGARGVQRVVLSVGYRWEMIHEHFGDSHRGMEVLYAVESTPLGTGGGIRLACGSTESDTVLVVNGDTFFDVDLNELARRHQESDALLTIALKRLEGFDRYGTVELREDGRILRFAEKQPKQSGLINGGLYALSRRLWDEVDVSESFSFERDVMERLVGHLAFYGCEFPGYFIDIGVPEDYERVQAEHHRLCAV